MTTENIRRLHLWYGIALAVLTAFAGMAALGGAFGVRTLFEALRAFGPCSMHRRTFIRNFHLEEPFGKS